MKYYIKGNTYQIKEDLKSFGCTWDAKLKRWNTPYLEKNELSFKRINSLVDVCNAEMIPVKLSRECKRIQDILDKEDNTLRYAKVGRNHD